LYQFQGIGIWSCELTPIISKHWPQQPIVSYTFIVQAISGGGLKYALSLKILLKCSLTNYYIIASMLLSSQVYLIPTACFVFDL